MTTATTTAPTAPTDRERWLAERRKGLGGSDMAAILAPTKRRNAIDVYLDKQGVPKPPEKNEKAMRRGQRLESLVLEEYAEVGVPDLHVEVVPHLIVPHPKFPELLASPDALDRDPDSADPGEPIEAAPIIGGADAKTAVGIAAGDYGPEGTDEVPDGVAIQCRWYMEILDVEWWDVAALIAGQYAFEFRFYRLERDRKFGEFLIETGRRFWRDFVVAGKMPPADYHERHADRLFPESQGKRLELASESVVDAMRRFAEADAAKKAADADRESARAYLKSVMAEAERLDVPSVGRVTWKTNKAGVRPMRVTVAEGGAS
ncbi:MAG: YqaJ viral recombinase family protein [Planctomycetota bacterium JB042]